MRTTRHPYPFHQPNFSQACVTRPHWHQKPATLTIVRARFLVALIVTLIFAIGA